MQDNLERIRDFFAHGGTLQAWLDLDPADLDQVYAYACQLFDAGDYALAQRYYLLLAQLCHWQFDYWLALGLSSQRLNEHEQAIHAFTRAGLLRLADPRAPYLAGLSQHLLGYTASVLKAFDAARLRCAELSEHSQLKAEIIRHATFCAQEN